MNRANFLAYNPRAEQLHEAGLQAAVIHNYPEAHRLFDEAQTVVSNSHPQSFDLILQSAHITRDDGWTDACAALKAPKGLYGELFDQARASLGRSISITSPYVSGASSIEAQLPQPHATPKAIRRELNTKHGIALSRLGRMTTAEAVKQGVNTRGEGFRARYARNFEQQPYGLAFEYLIKGNDVSEFVIHAMAGARQEILNGRRKHAAVWLGRAAYGLAWVGKRNVSNILPAAAALLSRLGDLRSYRAATSAVLARP